MLDGFVPTLELAYQQYQAAQIGILSVNALNGWWTNRMKMEASRAAGKVFMQIETIDSFERFVKELGEIGGPSVEGQL